MKKLAMIAALSSVFALTACSKEVTEVQKGSTVEVKNLKNASLSTNNAEDIQADMTSMQNLAMQQQQQAGDLDQRLNAALQSQNNDAVKQLFPEFKAAMQQNLAELSKLNLKSSEVTNIRQKMTEMMTVGLSMQEKLLDPNVQESQVQKEQARLAQLQQELAMASMQISSIITPQGPAGDAAFADHAPEDAAALEDAAPVQPE